MESEGKHPQGTTFGGSEFGSGFCYSLGLFLAHAALFEHDPEYKQVPGVKTNLVAFAFFAGARDHLIEFQVGMAPTSELAERCTQFRERVLYLGGGGTNPTEADRRWAIQEAKDILRFVDIALGCKAVKGQWE